MLGKGSELTCGALWRDRWRGSAISHPKDQARLTHWMFEAFSALPMRSHYINHIWFFKAALVEHFCGSWKESTFSLPSWGSCRLLDFLDS